MKLKERYRMLIATGRKSFTLNYSTRDLKMLGGPFLKEGTEFQSVSGIWQNYTMRTGMDTEAWVKRDVSVFKECVERLSERLELDNEYLQYNYSYYFKDAPEGEANKYGPEGAGAFMVDGLIGGINTRRPGQVYIELQEKTSDGMYEIVRTIDLRGCPDIRTTWGPIEIRRRKMGSSLPTKIADLKGFLSNVKGTVKIRHTYNTDAAA